MDLDDLCSDGCAYFISFLIVLDDGFAAVSDELCNVLLPSFPLSIPLTKTPTKSAIRAGISMSQCPCVLLISGHRMHPLRSASALPSLSYKIVSDAAPYL
jgi:hypothetical protein